MGTSLRPMWSPCSSRLDSTSAIGSQYRVPSANPHTHRRQIIVVEASGVTDFDLKTS